MNRSKTKVLEELSLRAKLTSESVTLTVIRVRDGAILQRIIPLNFEDAEEPLIVEGGN